MSVATLAELFFFSLSLGLGTCAFTANTTETGSGFAKLVFGLSAAFILSAGLLHLLNIQSSTLSCYLLSLLTSISIFLFHKDKKGPLIKGLFTLSSFLSLALIYLLFDRVQDALFFLSCAFSLGFVAYAMLLGHWHLVVPTLSPKPLQHLLNLTLLLLAGRLMVALSLWPSLPDGLFDQVLLLMKALWGYLAIGLMAFMARRLTLMHSIQSATGVLYAMTFFALGSELISFYIFLRYKIYL